MSTNVKHRMGHVQRVAVDLSLLVLALFEQREKTSQRRVVESDLWIGIGDGARGRQGSYLEETNSRVLELKLSELCVIIKKLRPGCLKSEVYMHA